MLKAALKDREDRLAALTARLADVEGKMKVPPPPPPGARQAPRQAPQSADLALLAAQGCRRCASGGATHALILHHTGDMSITTFQMTSNLQQCSQ